MNNKRDETLNELCSVFPQHSIETILYIYNNIVQNVGEENHPILLASCIENLLDLPDNFFPSHQELPIELVDIPVKYPPKCKYDVDRTTGQNSIIILSDEECASEEKSFNSSDDELFNGSSTSYRNRKRPTYREKNRISSDSSESLIGDSLFPENDDELFNNQEIKVLENKALASRALPNFLNNQANTTTMHNTSSKKRKLEPFVNYPTKTNENNSKKRDIDNNFIKLLKLNANLDRLQNNTESLQQNMKRIPPFLFPNQMVSSSSSVTIATANHEYFPNFAANPNLIQKTLAENRNYLKFNDSLSNSIASPNMSHVVLQPSFTPNKIGTNTKPVVLKNGTPEFYSAAEKQIVAVIEDVDPVHVRHLIKFQQSDFILSDLVNNIIEQLLDNKDYPKKPKLQPIKSFSLQTSSSTATKTSNCHYQRQAITILQIKFPQIATKVIRSVFMDGGCNYKPAFKVLDDAMNKVLSNESKPSETVIQSLLKAKRLNVREPKILNAQLQRDIEAVKKEAMEGDFNKAAELNIKQYEEEGQAIECGCCYGDATFEDMVQCLEGHLFCAECLQQYSKETVYGSGKAQLFCMTVGCDSTFPFSQLQKALPAKIMDKYFERVQDEDIKLANLCNLVRCPNCDFAAEMADGDKVFRCQNPICLKDTCRYCKEDWAEHFGLPCKEVEKKDTKHLRLSYEEKMTEAKVRTCWQCKTIFLKSSGCNKMTCRCGAKMCYICRKPKIDYNHFCQHVIEPGEGCKKCKRCFLWTDPTADDDRAVSEIQKEAEEEKKKLIEESSIISVASNAPE